MGVMDDEYFYKEKTLLPPADQAARDKEALTLKQNFIRDWAVRANLDLYKTEQERDWAFLVRKEIRYMYYKSIGIGFAWSSLACVLHSAVRRRVSLSLIALTPLVGIYAYYPRLNQETRRLFDMLNIGTEYELGAERNRVLEECNRIAKRADF